MDIRAIYRTCAQIALRNTDSERKAFEDMTRSLTLHIKNDKIINAMWREYGSILKSMAINTEKG